MPARSAFPPPAVLGALLFGAPRQPTGGRGQMPLRMPASVQFLSRIIRPSAGGSAKLKLDFGAQPRRLWYKALLERSCKPGRPPLHPRLLAWLVRIPKSAPRGVGLTSPPNRCPRSESHRAASHRRRSGEWSPAGTDVKLDCEQNCRLFRLPFLRRLGIELPARSAFPPPAVLGALLFGAPTQPTGGRAHMPLRML